ncbi:caspase family protein [Methylocystis heyeri]|uniref:Caspase family p20 domain-containing protein n=1 Tax=Methylocystis heyeri TaxID=391905 RepID=A0A6B8KHW7_9HYPH|nr:caspase family protein [Methylocystis heyeri]QGM47257.1 hypothetical protein H2LOC_017040 [Methylocystis heyeri]
MPTSGFSSLCGFLRNRLAMKAVSPHRRRTAAARCRASNRLLAVLCFCLWGLSITPTLADKRVALIVGNSKYAQINKLANPGNDAPDFAKAMESMGFEVILRVDVGKSEFDRALAEFARKSEGADTALFYYAGHGLQYQRQNFLLPTDIEVQDSADVEFRAVGLDRVLQAISRTSGVKILILDACRDNPLATQFSSRSIGDGGAPRGLVRIDRTEGLVIAYATAPDQVAQDGSGRNSPFTQSLINHIREPGLEIGTMFRRVANDVFEQTKGRQRPEISISLLNDYFLNPAENDRIVWSRIRDSDNISDFKGFIEKFPTSPFAQEAQFRIDLFERIRLQNEIRARLAHQHETPSRPAPTAGAAAKHENAKPEETTQTADAAARQAEADRQEVERLARENRAARKRLEAEPGKQGLVDLKTQGQGK